MSLLSPPLQAFLAITKCKTVHGAASEINLTQTAVTQRIRSLEKNLKTTLFIRTRRGMLLTREGEALLRYCQSVREIEGESLAKIKGTGIESEIQICITGATSIIRSRVLPACLPVLKRYPNLLLQFDINDTEDRAKSLRSGDSQLAIIQPHRVMAEMQHKILKPEKYILVCCKAWANRKLKDIIQHERIIDFDPTDQLTYDYLKYFGLFDFAKHDRHFANRTESLALMIEEGFGYGLLTKEFSQSYIDNKLLIPLNGGKIYENAIALAWYERTEPPQYFAALINAIN